jgi:parallel beta-helix repeat protein
VKRLKRRIPILSLLVLMAMAIPGPSALAHSQEVTSDLTLAADHTGTLFVTADGVTLDCAGHSVTPEEGDLHGIQVFAANDVTVKNCHVTGFPNVGITFDFVDGGTLEESSSSGNGTAGVRLSNSLNVSVQATSSFDNGLNGFFLRSSRFNQLIDVSAYGNGGGGLTLFNGSSQNVVNNGVFTANANVGISIDDSHDNVIVDNSVSDTTTNAWPGEGFWIHNNSSGNLLEDNVARDNDNNGFFLTGVSNNTLRDNSSIDNNQGFTLEGAQVNTLEGNESSGNDDAGIRLLGGSNQNTIDDNNTSGIRIVDSYENSVIDNRTLYNALGGIGLVASGGNAISDNKTLDNGANDLFLDEASQSLGNTFEDNKYVTSSGIG